jgi:predicted nucleotidyltransferase
MKNTSKINLDDISDSRLRDVLLVVDECCVSLGIDFYILGALARDVWFTKHGIAASGTKDVDFAVLLSEIDQFYHLKEKLINEYKYIPSKENGYVLIAPNSFKIDILPFGAIEIDDGVVVEGEGLKKIKVNGFKEVYLTSIKQVYVLEDKTFKVATLPGIFLLKLIAFDDRPERRQNDPIDCINIIKKYFEIESDLIWDKHNDLFGDEKALEVIAARVIGREMSKPLNSDLKLKERTINILKSHIAEGEKSRFVLRMAAFTYMGTEECTLYLSEILTGITEKLEGNNINNDK